MKKILLILFLVLIPIVNALYTDNVFEYFPFDKNNSNGSITAYQASARGILVSNTTGKINEAFKWDGSDKVNITYPNNANFSMIGNRTINIWLNTTSIAAYDVILNKGSASPVYNEWRLRGGTAANTLMFTLYGGTALSTPDITIAQGKWVMVTILYNNGTRNASVYRNATVATSKIKADAGTGATTGGFVVGAQYEDNGATPITTMDEICVYNQWLSDAEITALYNAGAGAPCWTAAAPNMTITNSTLNMTSEEGNIAWRTDTATYVPTTSGRPTVTFLTSANANCSMRANFADVRYNSSYACSTTGAVDHVCRINNSEKLSTGLGFLSIACSATANPGNNVTIDYLAINNTVSGISGLVSCIKAIGSGCGVSIESNCATLFR